MNDASRVRRTGRGLMFLAGATAVVLAGLGSWQVQRLAWKEALIAERTRILELPPLALRDHDAPAAFRRISLRGRLLNDRSLFVGPRTRRGRSGWRLITPLQLANDAGVVLVDRGWVPDSYYRHGAPKIGRPAGEVTVEGVIRRPVPTGPFAPENDPGRDQWFRVDPDVMARRLGLASATPFWIVTLGERRPGVLPIPDETVEMPSNNHLQYAITWYGLAVAALVVAAVYWRRERK